MSEKITPLRISINCDHIINELQRDMASGESNEEESTTQLL